MGKISVPANEDVSPNRSCGSPDRESSPESSVAGSDSGLCSLRGVQWRIRLGVLPATASSIDELRRAAANGRRKAYAVHARRTIPRDWKPRLLDGIWDLLISDFNHP